MSRDCSNWYVGQSVYRIQRPNIVLMALGIILTLSFVPVYAVDLNAELSSKGVPEKPTFRFVETAFVDYHNGGRLRDLLDHKNMTVSFQSDSSNPSIQDLIKSMNTNLSQDGHSSSSFLPSKVLPLIFVKVENT